ncbi:MAG: sugar-binding transcriptional regulator [Caldilineaceae bacterium]|nr:sugar-binding transcriptional regulator [Caldilineaceae bacterium]
MPNREETLAMVASLYYQLDQTQSQIAGRLGVSASKISRMIKEARDQGIVEINVRVSTPRDFLLEQEFIDRFGLQDAYVYQTSAENSPADTLRGVGALAAGYLQDVIPNLGPGELIGVAWGSGVHAAVSALPDDPNRHIDVVQLMGGVGALDMDSPDLARMVAAKLGGRHYDLHAPVLVEQPAVRETFVSEPVVAEAIRRARSVKLAITGIGTVADEASSFLRAGLLTRNDLVQLRREGAVGEMAGRYFDAQGASDAISLNRRIIGIELDDLRRIPQVLAVACGGAKVASIRTALGAGYLSVLATDGATAKAILETIDRE